MPAGQNLHGRREQSIDCDLHKRLGEHPGDLANQIFHHLSGLLSGLRQQAGEEYRLPGTRGLRRCQSGKPPRKSPESLAFLWRKIEFCPSLRAVPPAEPGGMIRKLDRNGTVRVPFLDCCPSLRTGQGREQAGPVRIRLTVRQSSRFAVEFECAGSPSSAGRDIRRSAPAGRCRSRREPEGED
jgi:hypothetical protein